MSYFGNGFLTGFADSLNQGIQGRTQEAKDYFNQQVEIAKTRGLEGKARVQNAVQGSVAIAKQLSQLGVPSDIIMAVANQNPTDLSQFYDQVSKAQKAGIKLDKSFFDNFIKVGGGFQAPNEDFQTFFSRMYDPIYNTAKQDPKGFNQDQQGGLFAAMFGFGAKQDAENKLAKYDVGGTSAADLIKYGDTIVPNKVGGDATVTYNQDYLTKETKAVTAGSKATNLSVAEINSIGSSIDQIKTEVTAEIGQQGVADPEEFRRKVNEEVYKRVSKMYEGTKQFDAIDAHLRKVLGLDDITQTTLPPLDDSETPLEDKTDTTPEKAETGSGTTPTDGLVKLAGDAIDRGSQPSSEAPTTSTTDTSVDTTQPLVDLTQEPRLYQIDTANGPLTFKANEGPGVAIYTDTDGKEYRISTKQLRSLVTK